MVTSVETLIILLTLLNEHHDEIEMSSRFRVLSSDYSSSSFQQILLPNILLHFWITPTYHPNRFIVVRCLRIMLLLRIVDVRDQPKEYSLKFCIIEKKKDTKTVFNNRAAIFFNYLQLLDTSKCHKLKLN